MKPTCLRVRCLVSGLAVWLCAALTGFAELPAVWKNIQPVTLARPGLVRFSVPLETLDAARPGLPDLRLFDAQDQEISFDLERPVQRAVLTAAPRKFLGQLETNATILLLETGQTQPLHAVTLQTPARDFLKAVRVEGSTDGRQWATIVDGRPVFALPDGTTQVRVDFAAGVWPHLRVTLDDRRTAAIPVSGVTLHPESAEAAASEPLGVEVLERSESERETRVTLRLAGGHVTLAGLSLVTSDVLFSRRVSLAERTVNDGEVRETPVASGFLYRLALEGRPATSNVTFAVDVPVASRELLLTIHNDDNPPLAFGGVTALRRPVFATLLNDRSGPLRLLSGNAHCAAPSYDLAALRRDLRVVPLVKAEVGALTANPRFTAPDPFALLAAGTTPLDVSAWRYRKAVWTLASGWQRMELDLDVLAHCSANFADLRLVTGGQQVPFVIERLTVPRCFAPTARPADDPKRAKTSVWQLTLPQKNLPLSRLTCETSAPLFRREVGVFEERADARGEKHRVPLGSATWQRTPEQKPGKLVVTLNEPPRSDALVLEVDNGDNPPLALTGFTAWHTTAQLYFRNADGPAPALYYGNLRTTAPRYDLALIANQFFAAPQAQARLGPEEILQPKPLAEALAGEPGNAVFWAVLVLVVLGLLFALHRLLPKPVEPGK